MTLASSSSRSRSPRRRSDREGWERPVVVETNPAALVSSFSCGALATTPGSSIADVVARPRPSKKHRGKTRLIRQMREEEIVGLAAAFVRYSAARSSRNVWTRSPFAIAPSGIARQPQVTNAMPSNAATRCQRWLGVLDEYRTAVLAMGWRIEPDGRIRESSHPDGCVTVTGGNTAAYFLSACPNDSLTFWALRQ